MFEREAYAKGFRYAAAGALVRSLYRADEQVEDVLTQPSTKGRASDAATFR